jgi:hypothetical protein
MIYLAGFGPGWAIYLMLSSVLYSCAVVRWSWKYGDLVVPDAEFTEAQRMMKRELHLWLGVIALQIIVLVVGWRFLGRQ